MTDVLSRWAALPSSVRVPCRECSASGFAAGDRFCANCDGWREHVASRKQIDHVVRPQLVAVVEAANRVLDGASMHELADAVIELRDALRAEMGE